MKCPRLSNEEFKKLLDPYWYARCKENTMNDKTKSTLKAFAAKYGKLVIIVLVGVGLYFGGEKARDLFDDIADIAEQIEGIEATLTEPTGLECVSEEP